MATDVSPQSIYLTARREGLEPEDAQHLSGVQRSEMSSLEALLQSQLTPTRRRMPSREDVVEGFMDAVRMSANAGELVQAWREIGRVVGAYEPVRVELSIERPTQKALMQMSDEQLAELAQQEDVLDAEYEELDRE